MGVSTGSISFINFLPCFHNGPHILVFFHRIMAEAEKPLLPTESPSAPPGAFSQDQRTFSTEPICTPTAVLLFFSSAISASNGVKRHVDDDGRGWTTAGNPADSSGRRWIRFVSYLPTRRSRKSLFAHSYSDVFSVWAHRSRNLLFDC